MIIYHGSKVMVNNPKIILGNTTKDFGYGFYCTKLIDQAEKWSIRGSGEGMLNIYLFNKNIKLKDKIFLDLSEEWLDFVVHCRRGGKHDYDVIEGPMADDKIWLHVEDFINGNMPRHVFWEYMKFNKFTHQICLCSEKSLGYLEYLESIPITGGK